MTATIQKITPTIAQVLLKGNTRNRPVTKAKVKAFATDIASGRWKLNGEAIKIAHTGLLLDGQHRLLAILEAGEAIDTYVIEGLPEAAQDTMDQGTVRTAASQLAINGIDDSTIRTTLARYLINHDAGQIHVAPSGGTGGTKALILEYAVEHAAEIDFGVIVDKAAKREKVAWSTGPVAAAAIIAWRHNKEEAREFFLQKVARGIGLEPGELAHALRRAYPSNAGTTKTRSDSFWLSLKAFKYHLAGDWNAQYIRNAEWTQENVTRF